MRPRLKKFLWVTGIASAVFATFPTFVVLGFVALVAPGVVMMLTPTAFLWGIVFAGFLNFSERRVGARLAFVVAGSATAALLFALPTPGQRIASSRYQGSLRPDVVPTAPLQPHGNVRLDYRYPVRSNGPMPRLADGTLPLACDGLCVALLFAPDVDSVTINLSSNVSPELGNAGEDPLNESARTYRLHGKPQCPDGNAAGLDFQPTPALVTELSREHRDAIESAWRLALSTDRCITAEPAVDHTDFLVREWKTVDPPQPSFLNRLAVVSSANIEGFEILDGEGRQLAHQRRVGVTAAARPLHFTFIFNSGVPEAGFRWARTVYENRKSYGTPLRLNEAVAAYTNLTSTLPPEPNAIQSVEMLRQALTTALADPSRAANDPVFGMGPAYFQALMTAGPTAEDLAVVRALIVDGRVTSFPSQFEARQVFGDSINLFREAVIERALSNAAEEIPWVRRLNETMAEVMPVGAFKHLSSQEEALLDDEVRRVRAPGLIYRLYDQGDAAVPRLVEILEFHLRARCNAPEKESGPDRNIRVRAAESGIAAARGALCRLGKDGAAAQTTIEEWFAEGFMPALIADSMHWKRLAFRFGTPIENIEFRNERQREQFQEQIARFEPEQHCTWLDF